MTELQSTQEEFLTCSICNKIYIDPCTLSCQHSFCRKCVTEYIKTRPEAVQSATIPCAICQHVTPVLNPTRPVDDWAKQMKPNPTLQELIDKLQSGHRHSKGHDICFLCNEVGETTPASSWCSDCEITLCHRCSMMHLKAPYSCDHDITDLFAGVMVKQKRKIKCREHKQEPIKVICKDCNKAVCQTCCIINHRACKHVVITDHELVIPEIKSTLTEKKRTLEQKMEETIEVVAKEESMIELLKTKEKSTEEQINSTIENATALLKKQQRDLVKHLQYVSGKLIVEHQSNVKSGQVTIQMYKQHCDSINKALQSESEMEMIDMFEACLSAAVGLLGDTKRNSKHASVVGEPKFTPNMQPLKKAVKEIGYIGVTCPTSMIQMSRENKLPTDKTSAILRGNKQRPFSMSTPVLDVSIKIKHKDDKYNPKPIDVTVLNVKGVTTLVVADYANESLKSVYHQIGGKEISQISMSARPRRLVKMTSHKVAAIVDDQSIVIVEVRPELILISTLKTSKRYQDIAILPNSKFAVVSSTPPLVDILDLDGNVLRSFTPHNTNLNLIKTPSNLCATNEGNIVVTDLMSMSVICLTPEGKAVFTHTPTGVTAMIELRIQGITVTNTGEILLADSESKRIIQLTTGGRVRDLLDTFSVPLGLHCDDTNKLYVCIDYSEIRVYK